MTTYSKQGRLTHLMQVVTKGMDVAFHVVGCGKKGALAKGSITTVTNSAFVVTDAYGNRFMVSLLEGEAE